MYKFLIKLAYVNSMASNMMLRAIRYLTGYRLSFSNHPLSSMESGKIPDGIILRRAIRAVTTAPRFRTNDDAQSCEVHTPDILLSTFRNAWVCGTSSSVVLENGPAFLDYISTANDWKYDYAAGHLVSHRRDTAIVKCRNPRQVDRGIFFAGCGAFNYYHFLTEIVAKAEFLPELPAELAEYPLLVSEDAVLTESFRDILALYAPNRELTVLRAGFSYQVARLAYINSPNVLPINMREGHSLTLSDVAIDPRSLDYLRRVALDASQNIRPRIRSPPTRLFLRRSGLRRNYNQNPAEEALARRGFVGINLEAHSFLEQVELMQNAEVIVGPTGAAWTNLLFCSPRTKALCWMATESGEFPVYSTIAKFAGVDLLYMTYISSARSTHDLYSKDYVLDVGQLLVRLDGIGIRE